MTLPSGLLTRADLAADLAALEIVPGDAVMVHAACSKLGRLINGPDTLIGALRDAVGPDGTVLSYTDWDAVYEDLAGPGGVVPEAIRPHIPPFDPAASRSIRDNGIFPEFLRTTPGALRSGNPGASIAAIGAKAAWLTENHPLDYGYGEDSPLARLVEIGGKVAMIGAPVDTMTLLHHAEHLARLPGKRIKLMDVPFARPDGVEWRMCEEFDTSDAIAPALDGIDYFTEIVDAFLATGQGVRGHVGKAETVIVDAAAITAFAVKWLEKRAG